MLRKSLTFHWRLLFPCGSPLLFLWQIRRVIINTKLVPGVRPSELKDSPRNYNWKTLMIMCLWIDNSPRQSSPYLERVCFFLSMDSDNFPQHHLYGLCSPAACVALDGPGMSINHQNGDICWNIWTVKLRTMKTLSLWPIREIISYLQHYQRHANFGLNHNKAQLDALSGHRTVAVEKTKRDRNHFRNALFVSRGVLLITLSLWLNHLSHRDKSTDEWWL